ncbi:two-component sensor histidine kinase [Massilia eurypsychrophila]|jgi:two-component system sensor histidine kinase DesK|uniref:Two-component sensor histidine kinase n=1 Tax=Massilia eurypsychrophila TaxID=1485217 RepID=A0A2G8T9U8_9BURK|nr:sensor histidine kinase [Massilia eurypsychrophila]PIL42825.1 two-component sensor histidine kinase [Massilia eurypsychrophila]
MNTSIKRLIHGPWLPPAMGKAPYLWIGSLVFFLMKYFTVKVSATELALVAATLLIFLPAYFLSFWPGRGNLAGVILTCLLGVVWAPYNFGAHTFFLFATAMCAGIMPLRRAYFALAGVLALALLVLVTVQTIALMYRLPVVLMALPIGLAAITDATLRRSREQLQRKQEEVEHIATIAERERISRDLHDLLGHTLSLITLKAELAGKLLGRNEAACRAEIADIEHSARNALAEVRAAVSGYRESGLAHELAGAQASLAAAGVAMAVEVQACKLAAATENVIALALREAVTNIVRHSGASRCVVRLAQEGGILRFRIADNGSKTGSIRPGNGLLGMRERVAALGGQLDVVNEQGMTLEITLPMKG